MIKEELTGHIEANNYEWAEGEYEGKTGVFARMSEEDPEKIFIDAAALPDLKWWQVKRMLLRGRDITQITRIVGYFSQVQNWNPSKIGELHDRQKGNYRI